jgi:hypothetical protein
MKKRISLLGCLTILSIGFLAPSAWADMGQFMPIRLTQVGALGYDPAHVKLPSDSIAISASFP